jgi:TolB protein
MSPDRKFPLSLLSALLLISWGASIVLPTASSAKVGDASRIVYESNRDNNDIGEIDSVLPSGAEPRVLLTSQNGGLDGPNYSPNRLKIAYARYLRTGNFEIFTMNANGKHRRQITHSIEDNEINGAPAYSPNGHRIAYESNRGTHTTQSHIFLISSNGGRSRQLTRGSGDDRAPSFSPNGREVVFSRNKGGYESICVISIHGGPVRTLAQVSNTTTPTDGDPDFSPSGKTIVFQGIENQQILIVNADGSGLRELAKGDAPAFSPSGNQIVFVSGEGASYGLYTMNSDGTNQRLIVPVVAGTETAINSPSW